MKYTFTDLKHAWKMYQDATDLGNKQSWWLQYCAIRDYLEGERKGLRQVLDAFDPREAGH